MSRLNCAADKSTVRALCSVFSACRKQRPPLSPLPTLDFTPEGEHSVRVYHACQGEQTVGLDPALTLRLGVAPLQGALLRRSCIH